MDVGNRGGTKPLPGLALNRDIATGEKVEAEIDSLISRRHNDRVRDEGERTVEEHWKASESAYFARRDEERRLELLAYHQAEAERYRNQPTKEGDAA